MPVVVRGFNADDAPPFRRFESFYRLWKRIMHIESLKLETLDRLKRIMLCQLDLVIFQDNIRGVGPYETLPDTLVQWSEVDNVFELDIDALDVESLPHILVDKSELEKDLGYRLYKTFNLQFTRIFGIRLTLAKEFKEWLQNPVPKSSPEHRFSLLRDATMNDFWIDKWPNKSLTELLREYRDGAQSNSIDTPQIPVEVAELTTLDTIRNTYVDYFLVVSKFLSEHTEFTDMCSLADPSALWPVAPSNETFVSKRRSSHP